MSDAAVVRASTARSLSVAGWVPGPSPACGKQSAAAAAASASPSDVVDPRDLATLRAWLRMQPHLPKDIPHEMLTLFLHSQNHSIEMAKMTLDRSYSIRTAAPELFSNRDPLAADVQDMLNVVNFGPLPRPTPEGFLAFVVGFRDPDPAKFMFVDCLKLSLMVLDLVHKWDGPVPGYRLIMDMRGTNIAHVAKINFASMKRGLDYQQEGLPCRLKGVHVINAIPLVNQILNIMRPLVKPETREMLHVHTEKQVSKFYEFVPKELMPRDYGGDAPPMDELHALVRSRLEQNASWFREEGALRVDESQRPAKAARYQYQSPDVFGCNGSFKKLNLD